jgi:hypothetical protein
MNHLILLGRNAQPPGPHPFHMPNDNELILLVSTYIFGMNTMSSSDNYSSIYKRCLQMRAQTTWERVGKHQHACPHIATLFELLVTKANVPGSWKEAKLTPRHKKGQVTIPGKYYRMIGVTLAIQTMIAVSGTLYRLYANLLRSRLVWSKRHNSWHKIWFFILAEARCTHCLSSDTSKMQHWRCRGAHYVCTQPSLISNKRMTPFQKQYVGPPLQEPDANPNVVNPRKLE